MTAADSVDANFNLTWRFARTMPHTPHEYVVRSPDNEADFVALFETINKHGRWGTFRGKRYRYWCPGDGHKYWTIHPIINRARIDAAAITDKITTAIIKYRRNKQLGAVWKRTPHDRRRVIDDRRLICTWREGGTELIPLDALTDAEIAERLPSRRTKSHAGRDVG